MLHYEVKKMVHGKTRSNLYFTKQDSPHDYMPGIFPAFYFSTIIELHDKIKLRFGNNFICSSFFIPFHWNCYC